MQVEYNPNIIKKVRKSNNLKCSWDILMKDNMKEEISGYMDEFRNSFNTAKEIAGKFPIALRLEPQIKKTGRDKLDISKFGGIPNLLLKFSPMDFVDRKSLDRYTNGMNPKYKNSKLKYNYPSVDEYVEKLWPRCNCCNSPMKFVGQLFMQKWLIAIHNATYILYDDGYSSSKKDKEFSYSMMGHDCHVAEHFPTYQDWHMFWFCDNGHYDNPIFDARCDVIKDETPRIPYEWETLVGNVPKTRKDMIPWTESEYIEAAKRFIKKYKLKSKKCNIATPIKFQEIVGYKPKFDIDVEGRYSFKCDSPEDKLLHKIENEDVHEVFSDKGDFQLFGRPSSQQTECRFACMNSYPFVHRMNPLLSWWDDKNDMTYQMYGCMKCRAYEGRDVIFCKIDSSCT